MSDDLDKSHKAWRRAEEAYTEAAEPYISGSHKLTKKAAIELSELRSKADARMQRYFKRAL